MRPYDPVLATAITRSDNNHFWSIAHEMYAYCQQGVQGYWIKAYRNLTSVGITHEHYL